MFKHIAILLALASVSAVVGCATETGPEEETETSGQAIMTAVGEAEADPMEGGWFVQNVLQEPLRQVQGHMQLPEGQRKIVSRALLRSRTSIVRTLRYLPGTARASWSAPALLLATFPESTHARS